MIYRLHLTRAPYNGEIAHETSSAKTASNWLADGRGRVSAESPDGDIYGCEPCNSAHAGRIAINLIRADGSCVGCVDPY